MEIPARLLCPKCENNNNVHRVIGAKLEEVANAWNCLTCQHRWFGSESDDQLTPSM
jgi:hypothetical protein